MTEAQQSPADVLLKVEHLRIEFPRQSGLFEKKKSPLIAVDDADFTIYRGETLGLVGESGCGKSTLGKAILRLVKTTRGDVFFEGDSLKSLPRLRLRNRRRDLQLIFQDPYSSLNPRQKLRDILEEPLIIHGWGSFRERLNRVHETLSLVGLREEMLNRYPHQLSGGQRQRIGIARALMLRPKFIICDEAVSALDVSIQSQILNLLKDLQASLGLTYLFISHDLNVVRYLCDRIVVMYLGRIMEIVNVDQLRNENFALHPYTRALLNSSPRHHPDAPRKEVTLRGEIPSPTNPPSGCVFRSRCSEAEERCAATRPSLQFYENRWVACLKRDNN